MGDTPPSQGGTFQWQRGCLEGGPLHPVFPGHGSGQHTLILQIRGAYSPKLTPQLLAVVRTGGARSTSPVEMAAHVGSFSFAEMSPPRKRITTRNRPVPSGALNVGLCPATDGRGMLAAAHPWQLRLRVRNEGFPSKLCLHTAEQCLPPTDLRSLLSGSGSVRRTLPEDYNLGCLTRHPPRLCNRPSAIL